MEKWQNLPYLLTAYGVVWLGFFLYLIRLALRQGRLEKEIRVLEAKDD